MSDMLGISSNAIGAYQRALSTVANNISNVNTEGYSRQDVVLKDSAPKKLANMYVGTGTILQNIKRQYDAFAESNLRNSTSDLASQKPMVDYAKRVMDIMGDKSIGLSSAFDDFFAAAGALSTDPASTVQRTSFLRSADGVASRFGELNTQLELIATETRQGVESVAAQINPLTSQLALINQSMTKSPTLESQPAELLDRRDLTLRQLSDLVRIKTTFSINGSVNVSLGATMTQGLVVNGNKARPIGIDSAVQGKIELVLDPYGKTESLSSASGGQLGGYQSFISQVLDPAQKNLSALAQTFVSETNTIQKNGIDGYGQMGTDLFAVDAKASSPAAGMHLAVNDGMRVATAAQFRVGEGNTNITTTRATVKFTGITPVTQLSNSQLVNNPNAAAGVTFKVDGARVFTPVTALSAGVKAAFYLDEAEPGQQLQVLTRDGRQLLGQTLSETEKYQLFTPDNGFAQNANYSDAYLNQTGNKAYRGIDMFYGAKAEVLFGQNFDQYGAAGESLPLAASMETSRISSSDAKIPAGAITVNGLALPAFDANTDSEIIISGTVVGTPSTDFNFQAVVGGQVVGANILSANTGSMSQMAAALNASLQAQGVVGIVATAINNNADIRITDGKGRDISGASLLPTSLANGAAGGDVQVNSAAVQVANWINGSSQATVLNPMFGITPNSGFSKFQATLGGVSFDLNPIAATNLSSLAEVLQQQFRTKDQSTDISVVLDGAHLKITDTRGRAFKNFALIPTDENSLATGGRVEITNSNVSQTHVRAEVFSQVRVPVSQLNMAKPLTINGQVISGYNSVNQLVDQINASNAGVTAAIETNGEFVLTDPLGSPIRINATTDGNALDIQPNTYNAQVRMVQVVRDIRVSAADIDFNKPLTINGMSMSEAAYQLPLNVPSSVQFGFPAKSVSAANPTNLVKALNSLSSISQVSLPDAAHTLKLELAIDGAAVTLSNLRDTSQVTQTIGFTAPALAAGTQINVGGVQVTLPVLPGANNGDIVAESVRTALLASPKFSGYSITRQLNELVLVSPEGGTPVNFSTTLNMGAAGEDVDLTAGVATTSGVTLPQLITTTLNTAGYTNIDVKLENGALIFSNTVGKQVTPMALNSISIANPLLSASAGTIDKTFAESYVAFERNGAVVISSNSADALDVDIKNSFVFKSQGNEVAPEKGISTLQGFVDRINAKVYQTGVVAEIDLYGDLKLSTTDEKGTLAISIGPGKDALGNQTPNALGLDPMDYGVTERLKRKLQDPDFISDIRVSFGSYGDPKVFGDPADLSKMGLRTGAFIEAGSPDELLLFITGKGAAKVAAGYEGAPDNVRDSLRAQSLNIKFTAENRYTITDAATGTELADRFYDPTVLEPVVEFQGLQVKLSHAPAVGDSYKIDGNFDGLGNNVNMLEMVDLNKKPTANGKTIANTYIDQINNVGNLAQQAIITQEALTVVNDQAVSARDKVSGVNLDDEAAALIRYQQAYQACAKALQISGELFDSIIQIR